MHYRNSTTTPGGSGRRFPDGWGKEVDDRVGRAEKSYLMRVWPSANGAAEQGRWLSVEAGSRGRASTLSHWVARSYICCR